MLPESDYYLPTPRLSPGSRRTPKRARERGAADSATPGSAPSAVRKSSRKRTALFAPDDDESPARPRGRSRTASSAKRSREGASTTTAAADAATPLSASSGERRRSSARSPAATSRRRTPAAKSARTPRARTASAADTDVQTTAKRRRSRSASAPVPTKTHEAAVWTAEEDAVVHEFAARHSAELQENVFADTVWCLAPELPGRTWRDLRWRYCELHESEFPTSGSWLVHEDDAIRAHAALHAEELLRDPLSDGVWISGPELPGRTWAQTRWRYLQVVRFAHESPPDDAVSAGHDDAGRRSTQTWRSPATLDGADSDDDAALYQRNLEQQERLLRRLSVSAGRPRTTPLRAQAADRRTNAFPESPTSVRRHLDSELVQSPRVPASAAAAVHQSPAALALEQSDAAALAAEVDAPRASLIRQTVRNLAHRAGVELNVAFHALVACSGDVHTALAYLEGADVRPWTVVEDQLVCLTSGDKAARAVKKLRAAPTKRSREEIIARCEWMSVSSALQGPQ